MLASAKVHALGMGLEHVSPETTYIFAVQEDGTRFPLKTDQLAGTAIRMKDTLAG